MSMLLTVNVDGSPVWDATLAESVSVRFEGDDEHPTGNVRRQSFWEGPITIEVTSGAGDPAIPGTVEMAITGSELWSGDAATVVVSLPERDHTVDFQDAGSVAVIIDDVTDEFRGTLVTEIPEETVVTLANDPLWEAKGDLVVGHEVAVAERLPMGTDGQVLTIDPEEDLGLAWEDPSTAATDDHIADTTDAHDASAISFSPTGTIAATDVQAAIAEVASEGAPTGADYLVGTAQGGLSAEIVVGTTPGGELGNTWASPTVDTTHSGSSHAATQAAAEATADAALDAHEATADPHTGYLKESEYNTKGDLIAASANDTPSLLAAGTDGYFLKARSSATPGLAYEPVYRTDTFANRGTASTYPQSFFWATDVAGGRLYYSDGSTWTAVAPSKSLEIHSQVSVTNDATETTIVSWTIPANLLDQGTVILFRFGGLSTTPGSGPPSMRFRVKMNSVYPWDSSALTQAISQTDAAWHCDGMLTVQAAPGASVAVKGIGSIRNVSGSNAANQNKTTFLNVNVATNANVTFLLTMTMGTAVSGATLTGDLVHVQVVN